MDTVKQNLNRFFRQLNASTTHKELFIVNWKLFSYLMKPECEYLFTDPRFAELFRNKCHEYLDKKPHSVTFVAPLAEKYFPNEIILMEKIKRISNIESPEPFINIEIDMKTPKIECQKLYYDSPKPCKKCNRSFRYIVNYTKHFCWQ